MRLSIFALMSLALLSLSIGKAQSNNSELMSVATKLDSILKEGQNPGRNSSGPCSVLYSVERNKSSGVVDKISVGVQFDYTPSVGELQPPAPTSNTAEININSPDAGIEATSAFGTVMIKTSHGLISAEPTILNSLSAADGLRVYVSSSDVDLSCDIDAKKGAVLK